MSFISDKIFTTSWRRLKITFGHCVYAIHNCQELIFNNNDLQKMTELVSQTCKEKRGVEVISSKKQAHTWLSSEKFALNN